MKFKRSNDWCLTAFLFILETSVDSEHQQNIRIFQTFHIFNIQADLVCTTLHLWLHANPKPPGAVKYAHIYAATLPLLLVNNLSVTQFYISKKKLPTKTSKRNP